jgi:hypothetical protein
MSETPLETHEDEDVLVPDDPEHLHPDHDESLAPWLVPEDEPLMLWPRDILLPKLRDSVLQAASAAPNVKFPREILQGHVGKDVIAHKRAISRARPDLYPWPQEGGFTDLAGPLFLDAVVKWKKSKGLGSTRVLGGRAHESLERTHRRGSTTEWAFDARAIQLAQEYWESVTKTPEQMVREAICAAGFFWHSHKLSIAYSQARPFELGRPPFVPQRWDCSAFATNCHFAGGAPDPNGRGYDHLGYTGTLMTRGTRVSTVGNLDPGDLIFYGHSVAKPGFNAGDPTHVALYVGYRDGAHMVLSMGSYPMSYVRYDYRHDLNHFRHYNVAPAV